jgi:hypothetical protein
MNDKDNHYVITDIKNSDSKAEKYFCSYCNTRLTPLTDEDRIGAYVLPSASLNTGSHYNQ